MVAISLNDRALIRMPQPTYPMVEPTPDPFTGAIPAVTADPVTGEYPGRSPSGSTRPSPPRSGWTMTCSCRSWTRRSPADGGPCRRPRCLDPREGAYAAWIGYDGRSLAGLAARSWSGSPSCSRRRGGDRARGSGAAGVGLPLAVATASPSSCTPLAALVAARPRPDRRCSLPMAMLPLAAALLARIESPRTAIRCRGRRHRRGGPSTRRDPRPTAARGYPGSPPRRRSRGDHCSLGAPAGGPTGRLLRTSLAPGGEPTASGRLLQSTELAVAGVTPAVALLGSAGAGSCSSSVARGHRRWPAASRSGRSPASRAAPSSSGTSSSPPPRRSGPGSPPTSTTTRSRS